MSFLPYDKIADCVIKVKLGNGYEVVAMRKHFKAKGYYVITLYLKTKTVDFLDKCMSLKILESNITCDDIDKVVACAVAEVYEEGKLNYYFERYDYYMRTMAYGDSVLAMNCKNKRFTGESE